VSFDPNGPAKIVITETEDGVEMQAGLGTPGELAGDTGSGACGGARGRGPARLLHDGNARKHRCENPGTPGAGGEGAGMNAYANGRAFHGNARGAAEKRTGGARK
jgi:hypothetical protein